MPDAAVASIVSPGGLDGLNLKHETFTVVGYGYNDDPVGNLMSSQNPNFALTWSGRNYTYATGVTNHDAFGDRCLKITPSGNAGDPGGPVFRDGKVVALTVWGGNRAESPNYDYRLDTASAQNFMTYWLENGPTE